MVHGEVVAQVDEAVAAVLGGGEVVGVLDEHEEGVAGVVDVEPVDVVGQQRAVEREDEAVRAERVAPVVALAEGVGQLRDELEGEAGGEGGGEAGKSGGVGEGLVGAAPADGPGRVRRLVGVMVGFDYFVAEEDFAAEAADLGDEGVVEALEAASEVTELEGTIVDAGPEPG